MTRAELGELIETIKKRRDEITDYLCDCDSYFRGRRYECKWFLSFLEKYYEREPALQPWECTVGSEKEEDKPERDFLETWDDYKKRTRRGAREIWDLI